MQGSNSVQTTYYDTLEDQRESGSSQVVLDALNQAKRSMALYESICDKIDNVYSLRGAGYSSATSAGSLGIADREYDLFWSSMEILKPAVYARPPQPIAVPRFKDRNRTVTVASEALERCLISTFDRGHIDEVSRAIRDDLIFAGRGVIWLTYETDAEGGGKRVCIEHLDRCDFLHEPAKHWCDVGWVARRAWMTQQEMHDRFYASSGLAYLGATFNVRADERDGGADASLKCSVWEVWHRNDNRVYWVAEEVEQILDESDPYLDLQGFFPCPRPAYGTLKRRTLVPVPDYERYQLHFDQIDELTARIYAMLEWIRVKGLIPAGGEVGEAVVTALQSSDVSTTLIPVPAATMISSGVANFVQFLPIDMWANAISGLIQARNQLFEDFYQLSGISDIMRGATEANETLGAQRLKSQFGSVRVKEKIDELQRVIADATKIAAEIIAEKFDPDTILEMSQMDIPTKADISKNIKELEKASKAELQQLAAHVQEQMASEGEGVDQQELQEQFQVAQNEIVERFQPLIRAAGDQVALEDVMKLLRSDRMRSFVIDIETDSTVLIDEGAEKQSRAEFLTAFSGAATAVAPLIQAGEAGARLAGAMIKFAIAPYRVGRELDGLIDDFIETAPSQLQDDGANNETQMALVAAQSKLADAEIQKAQAQIAKVQADTAVKTQELQLKAAEAQQQAQQDQQSFALELEKAQVSVAEAQAKIQKMESDIQIAFERLMLDQQKEERVAAETRADIESQQLNDAINASRAALDAMPAVLVEV